MNQFTATKDVQIVELSSSDDNDAPKITGNETSSSDNILASPSTSEEDHVHRDHVVSEELKKIKDIPPNLALIQTFYEHPWSDINDYAEFSIEKWKYGKSSEKNNIRSATFQHLWNEGFYLTAGDKFGADFLAYPGTKTNALLFYKYNVSPLEMTLLLKTFLFR